MLRFAKRQLNHYIIIAPKNQVVFSHWLKFRVLPKIERLLSK